MTDRSSDEDLARLVAELVDALGEIERELEPPEARRGPRPPRPGELRRFASEVAIPGLILVLETNVRALRLLQRALELGDDAGRASEGASELRDRATAASETTLRRLDDALAGLQRAVEGRPGDGEAAELLEEARALRHEVRSRLDERPDSDGVDAASPDGERRDDAESHGDAVEIDVDAELESIREELDATEDGDDDGVNGAEDAADRESGNGADTDES